MPAQTNLSTYPYYDDYDENKNFYKILFKPKVAVQTRELNQLQTILQNQVEKFGDNIFKTGTIVDGCHTIFHDNFPYVKIKDVETDGKPVNVSTFEGYNVTNSSNLQGIIVKTVPGFESQNPNLNTLYIRYTNSGTSLSDVAYSADQTLTIFDKNNVVFNVNVVDGSLGFSNTDSVVVYPAIGIQNSSGGSLFTTPFVPGQIITNGNSANAVILSVNTTANAECLILQIRPFANNLHIGNSALWTFASNDSILNTNTSVTGKVSSIVGAGASASLVTTSISSISEINIQTNGAGYYVNPYIAVSSVTASVGQIAQANLVAQTYLTQITVANTSTNPIGSGYAMSIDDGYIYQKGYFIRVDPQLIVVEKYDSNPDELVVGFNTIETLINSNIDTSLLDNVTGVNNATAPGADRLKLSPELIVVSKSVAAANTDFLSVAEFSQGYPFKQTTQTQYNIIGDEIAKRTYEEAGNFVVDQFLLNTKSKPDFATEPYSFNVVVDPGLAYISGNRVQTVLNYTANVAKATVVQTLQSSSISLNYGNYILVNQVGGIFKFNVGDLVNLYDAPYNYLTVAGSPPSTAGNLIGTARVRSFVYDSGEPGTTGGTYRLYLFNILMNSGSNFSSVKSIFYNGINKGVADVVQTNGTTKLIDNGLNSALYNSGVSALFSLSNISYVYRSLDETLSANTSGIIQKTSGVNKQFPYISVANIASIEKSDIIIIPLANGQSANSITGTVAVSNNVITGTGTSFLNNIAPGDFLKVIGASQNEIVQIASISNNTSAALSANVTTISSANAFIFFPMNVPIPFASRANRTANVTSSNTVLTINLGTTLTSSINVAVMNNILLTNISSVSKTISRNNVVRIDTSSNIYGANGPWPLGVSDVFRLKNVYLGKNNTFTNTDSGVLDVTNDFYVDHNQNENFYGISYLYLKSRTSRSYSATDRLLVVFDSFITTTDGLKSINSYNINDGITYNALSNSSINTAEIPEMYTTQGTYFDLRDSFDFRPVSANTITLTSNVSLAPINPVEPSEANRFTTAEKYFPAPQSSLIANFSYYVPRTDRVIVDTNSNISVLKGTASANSVAPVQPNNALTLNILKIPAYPSYPFALSGDMANIIDTKVANEKYSYNRFNNYQITSTLNNKTINQNQTPAYTMKDIAGLDHRIAALEYYVQLTLLQTQTQQRIIPSSSNSSINRFKFGFFADSFTSTNYSDVSNPDYYASIINNTLLPKQQDINFEFDYLTPADAGAIGFNEYTLINQNVATDDNTPIIVAPVITQTTPATVPVATSVATPIITTPVVATPIITTPVVAPIIPSVTQSTICVNVSSKNDSVKFGSNYADLNYETQEFKFSSLPSIANIKIQTYNLNVVVDIFQGTRQGFSIIGLNPIISFETYQNPNYISDYIAFGESGSVSSQFNHNPANGVYYVVRIGKHSWAAYGGSVTHRFQYTLCYPTDSGEVITPPAVLPTSFTYTGTVTDVTPPNFTISSTLNVSSQYGTDNIYQLAAGGTPFISDSQVFRISCSGLKPNTIHSFVFDSVNSNSKCKIVYGRVGDNLVSTASGVLIFDFYYDAGIAYVYSDFASINKAVASIVGNKTFTVKNSDGSSIASGSILLQKYIIDVNAQISGGGYGDSGDGLYLNQISAF